MANDIFVLREQYSNNILLPLQSDFLSNREIVLTGEINDESAAALISQLHYLDRQSDEPITLYIHSPGGSVSAGLAIYDTLQLMKSEVHAVAVSHVASIASLIFIACKKRYMMRHAELMIHNPLLSEIRSANMQKVDELQKLLHDCRDEIATILVRHSHQDIDSIKEMMDKETWLNPIDAISTNFADDILTKGVIDNDR